MSKGLEAFNNILAEGDFRYFSSLYDRDMFKEDVIAVKKELKALEIIKKKRVNVIILMGCDSVEEYNKHPLSWKKLTQEEWDLLKEVLK